MNKVDTSGGEITTDDDRKTKMELTSHENGVASTIGKNGNETRDLNKGTVVISFSWDEVLEESSFVVAVLEKNKSLNSYVFHPDVNDATCFHKSDGAALLKELHPGNIRLATINGSNTVPNKIQLDLKLMDMVNAIVHEEEVLHAPPVDMPVIYGRGLRGRVPNRRLMEE